MSYDTLDAFQLALLNPTSGPNAIGFDMAVPYAPNTLGSRVSNHTRGFYNPLDYLAVGDGVANDTEAVQNCIAAMPADSVLWLPGDRVFNIPGGVTLTKQDVTITGGGGLANGPLILNMARGTDIRTDINHIKFIGSAFATNAIELISARRVTVTNCVFDQVNVGILRRRDAGQVFHSVAMVRITNNDFNTVNYALKVEHNADVNSWQYTSDCAFDKNQVNIARVCQIDIDGIDGAHILGNVMFMVGYTSSDTSLKASKTNNIRIGQSDWIVIEGNNLFEAGLESILLNKAKHFNISNNHIAWPGQRQPSDAIRLTGNSEPNGVISGNTLSRFTRYGVSVETNLDTATNTSVNVFGNTMEWMLNPPSYYGTVDLSTIASFTVYQPTNSPTTVTSLNNPSVGGLFPSIRSRLAEGVALSSKSSISATAPITKAVTAATTLATLTSGLSFNTSVSYAGMLQIEVRNLPGTLGSNVTSYILHITKQLGGAALVSVISQQGLVAGAGAKHPSFTFTVVDDQLTVTPIGLTSGTFLFWITAMGGIGVYA